MLYINYKSDNYPITNISGYNISNQLLINWSDIIYSAITVGKASRFDVLKNGLYSYYEIIYRSALVFSNLKSGVLRNIVKTDVYSNLDPSEKSAVSYYLGLTIAKLLANRVLAVPWLLHLDVYQNEFSPKFWKGNTRPDLIGRNLRRDWVVYEAKGRTSGYDTKAFDEAKNQTRNIKTIDGVYPSAKVASEIYFSKGLSVRIEDPEEINPGAKELDIGDDRFFSKYYELFVSLINNPNIKRNNLFILDQEFYVIDISEVDLKIGLARNIFECLKNKDYKGIFHFAEKFTFQKDARATKFDMMVHPNLVIERDGILVELGSLWNERSMLHEPTLRL